MLRLCSGFVSGRSGRFSHPETKTELPKENLIVSIRILSVTNAEFVPYESCRPYGCADPRIQLVSTPLLHRFSSPELSCPQAAHGNISSNTPARHPNSTRCRLFTPTLPRTLAPPHPRALFYISKITLPKSTKALSHIPKAFSRSPKMFSCCKKTPFYLAI